MARPGPLYTQDTLTASAAQIDPHRHLALGIYLKAVEDAREGGPLAIDAIFWLIRDGQEILEFAGLSVSGLPEPDKLFGKRRR